MAAEMRAVWGRPLAVVACPGKDRKHTFRTSYDCKSGLETSTNERKVSCSVLKFQFYSRVLSVSALHCLRQPGDSNALRRESTLMKASAETKENVVETEENLNEEKVDYNWETEWYPLYLTEEVPRDAPLALNVFDRSLVLFYDGEGNLNCLEDRCPHRLAKLSEGQVIDGNLECLYHGWQFRGDGSCAKLPQEYSNEGSGKLAEAGLWRQAKQDIACVPCDSKTKDLVPGAKIPKQACARSYALKESQGVVWVWMADKNNADPTKLPLFEHFDEEGFGHISTIHEMPYDYSILLENLVDPAHIPISHGKNPQQGGKREDAQALEFEFLERTGRGFAGLWNKIRVPEKKYMMRFQAPCTISNAFSVASPKDGSPEFGIAVFLCRPSGQGKSMAITRFGFTNFYKRKPLLKWVPAWVIHIGPNTLLEQDMGFLSSQNEALTRENRPTKDLYLNNRSQDAWVLELRQWMDKVGHGLPYYWGHRTASAAPKSALEENAPAGLFASSSASFPSKGAIGSMFARDPTHRYYRHFVHCKSCRNGLKNLQRGRDVALAVAALSIGLALTAFYNSNSWRIVFVVLALLSCAASWACSRGTTILTQRFFRPHRYS